MGGKLESGFHDVADSIIISLCHPREVFAKRWCQTHRRSKNYFLGGKFRHNFKIKVGTQMCNVLPSPFEHNDHLDPESIVHLFVITLALNL